MRITAQAVMEGWQPYPWASARKRLHRSAAVSASVTTFANSFVKKPMQHSQTPSHSNLCFGPSTCEFGILGKKQASTAQVETTSSHCAPSLRHKPMKRWKKMMRLISHHRKADSQTTNHKTR